MKKIMTALLFILSLKVCAFSNKCEAWHLQEFEQIASKFHKANIQRASKNSKYEKKVLSAKFQNIYTRAQEFNKLVKCDELNQKSKDALVRIKANISGEKITKEQSEFIDA